MIIVNCIEGAAGAFRKERDTTSNLVLHVMKSFATTHPKAQLVFHEVVSSMGDPIDNSRRFIKNNSFHGKNRTHLLLVGKSLGAVFTWWLVYDHWDQIKNYGKVYLLTIDPHGPVIGDGTLGPYKKGRNLKYLDDWMEKPDFWAVNIYQQDHFPTGARFEGIENFRLPKGSDHWNITDVDSKYSNMPQDKILQGLVWMIGER